MSANGGRLERFAQSKDESDSEGIQGTTWLKRDKVLFLSALLISSITLFTIMTIHTLVGRNMKNRLK